jgi:hypothetical protein
VHLRAPSMDQGVAAGLWGIFFGVFVWAGLWSIAVAKATAFIAGCLVGAAVFLLVRFYGGDSPPADRR